MCLHCKSPAAHVPCADAQVWSRHKCSSSCKARCFNFGLCRPYTALKASYAAVRSSYHRELRRQLPPGPTHLQQGWQGGAPCLTGHLALPADNTQSLPCIDRRVMLQPCQASLQTLANPVCMYITTNEACRKSLQENCVQHARPVGGGAADACNQHSQRDKGRGRECSWWK